jgi:hypothetical protein
VPFEGPEFHQPPGLTLMILKSLVFGHKNKIQNKDYMEVSFSIILQLKTNVNKLQDNQMSLMSMDLLNNYMISNGYCM